MVSALTSTLPTTNRDPGGISREWGYRSAEAEDLASADTAMQSAFGAELRSRAGHPDRMNFHLRTAQVGELRVGCFGFGTAIDLENLGPVDQVNVGVITSGRIEVRMRDGSSTRFETGDRWINGPGNPMVMRLSADLRFSGVFLPRATIHEHLSVLTGRRSERRITFDQSPRPAGSIRPMLAVLDEAVRGTRLTEIAVAHLTQLTLSAVLLTFKHSYTQELEMRSSGRRPRTVRLVESALRERPGHPWRLADLAREAGVSGRTVQAAFLEHVGHGPFELLRQIRLEHAHDDLRMPQPGCTVSDVASRWGFAHLGRFSASYGARYGESPSATLRRSRVG